MTRINWGHWDSQWEAAQAVITLTKRGYEILSEKAIQKILFPRLYLGYKATESSGLVEHDKAWEMVWTTDPLLKDIESIAWIEPRDFGCLRHNKSSYGSSSSYVYGYRVSIDWYQSGLAQATLLPIDQMPRPSMAGVCDRYLYEVKSDSFIPDMKVHSPYVKCSKEKEEGSNTG